jgi:hypothetical protein
MGFTLPRNGRLWVGRISLAGMLLLFLGSFCLWYEVHDAKSNWQTAPGRILTSGFKQPRIRGRTEYAIIDVHYTYEVANLTYSRTKVSFRNLDRPIRQAKDTAARYRPGDIVTVYYDPEDPQEAVLEIGESDAGEMFFAGLFVSLLPLLIYAREVKQIGWAKKLR